MSSSAASSSSAPHESSFKGNVPFTMKAAALREYGTDYDKCFVYEKISTPQHAGKALGANQVLIQVIASSINPVDWKITEGGAKLIYSILRFPFILGRDAAGIVVAIGAKVKHFRVGDHVFGFTGKSGCWAEYALFNESELARKPPGLSWRNAAGIPLVLETAFQCFKSVSGGISKDLRVLINGASGGVGTWAVLLACQYYNVSRVYATCSTENIKYVQSLGATWVIDYKTEKIENMIPKDKAIDVCIDLVGGNEMLNRLISVMNPKGTIVTVGAPSEVSGITGAVSYYGKLSAKVIGSWFGRVPHIVTFIARPTGNELERLADWIIENKLQDKMRISGTFPLNHIAEAIKAQKESHGKVIVAVNEKVIESDLATSTLQQPPRPEISVSPS